MPRRNVRAEMVAGAARLLASKGLEGTSFAEVLAATGAPRGSTYHHFPGGKHELVQDAVKLAGERAMAALEPIRGEPAPVVIRRFLGLWRQLLQVSDFGAGCAVLAVTVAADDADLLVPAGRVFRAWRGQLESLLQAGGVPTEHAPALAALLLASCEGAVVIARAEHSLEPLDLIEPVLIAAAEAATPSR